MQLDKEILYKLADWKSLTENWIDFEDDDRPAANYSEFEYQLKTFTGFKISESDGWNYGDTYFDYFIHKPNMQDGFDQEGVGIHVALSRFGPIGIYCSGRKAWTNNGASSSCPSLSTLYQIPDHSFVDVENRIIELFRKCGIYRPSKAELEESISFELPEIFKVNANLGKSKFFDILINDLY